MSKFKDFDLKKASNDLAREILEMANKDQNARFSNIDPEEIKKIDIENTSRLKYIIKAEGYPTINDIGKEASNALWLLIQHADLDRDFQNDCLKIMKELPKESIDQKNIAYLEDRVRIGKGQPQFYGTQFHRREDGKLVLRDIEDIENVDERRSKMNLGPLDEIFIVNAPKKQFQMIH